MKKIIMSQYDLQLDDKLEFGGYESYRKGNHLFTVVPVNDIDLDELNEWKLMSDYIVYKGDPFVANFLHTKNGELVASLDKRKFVILHHLYPLDRSKLKPGKELAAFHQKGRMFPYKTPKCNRIGQWKILWEQRVDQMELFWKAKISQQPSEPFEKLFIESFPYYLGLTENAIQYLVDTELDDQALPIDSATICHHRFSVNLWRDHQFIKFPIDWVLDHCSRDLAECLRAQFISANYHFDETETNLILKDYNRLTPLSSFSWRLLYARLLFPLHYFECIEGYYISGNKRHYSILLEQYLNTSSNYERFLYDCQKLIPAINKKVSIPIINWLA